MLELSYGKKMALWDQASSQLSPAVKFAVDLEASSLGPRGACKDD
jgi:hypothetical protein